MPVKHCQHCFKSEGQVSLKACKNCRAALYCSPECQRAEWKQHKKECQPIKNTLDSIWKEVKIPFEDAEELMEKWVQFYRPPLMEATKHGMKIQWNKDIVLTHCLNVVLSPTFTPDKLPKKPSEVRAAFSFASAFVSPIERMMKAVPERFRPDINATIQSSREARAQKPNIIGYAIVMLLVPACSIMKQVRLGLLEEERVISLDPEWVDRLAWSIARHLPGKSYHFLPEER